VLEDGKEVNVDLNDFSISKPEGKMKIDYAFIIIHGTPGEDGRIQAYLDLMGVPYNTSGVLSSALSFNKYACKSYLKNFNILTAESVLITKNKKISEDEIIEKVGIPCFVKPNNGGSSYGITRVNKPEEMTEAIDAAFKEDSEVIIETYIKGIELSCGLVKTSNEEFVFPVTEIVSHKEFFDYEAKYTEGMADEITPARIPEDLQKKIQSISSAVYDLLYCKGLVRVDFIAKGNQLYFLELNSVPGMSMESILPKQIRAAGYRVEEIMDKIIMDTL
jgi:D-alanine-D-alanine ligase